MAGEQCGGVDVNLTRFRLDKKKIVLQILVIERSSFEN